MSPCTSVPQSIFERLSSGNSFSSQQSGRRRSKNSTSGTLKSSKSHRNRPLAELWSLAESTSDGAIFLKARLLEAAKKFHQKEVRQMMKNEERYFFVFFFFFFFVGI